MKNYLKKDAFDVCEGDMVCASCGCTVSGVGMSNDVKEYYVEVCNGCGQVEPEKVSAENSPHHECFICNS